MYAKDEVNIDCGIKFYPVLFNACKVWVIISFLLFVYYDFAMLLLLNLENNELLMIFLVSFFFTFYFFFSLELSSEQLLDFYMYSECVFRTISKQNGLCVDSGLPVWSNTCFRSNLRNVNNLYEIVNLLSTKRID